jgi:molybdate transport system substrate-binding protein
MEETMKSWLLFPMLATLFAAGSALGAEISVLSGGAVEPGLVAAAETFRKETGTEVRITFATAPAIRQQVGAGEKADVVIAPPAVIEELMKSGKLEGQGRVTVGRVGIGVVVRDGAPKPDVSNTEAFKHAMLEAETLVYNTASSGIYVEKMLERLGMGEQLKDRTKRYPTGSAVMEHLIRGTGKEVGIGPITEIKLYSGKGLQFVGPLPPEIQNYTSYDAAPVAAPANRDGAIAFLKFLGASTTKALFVAKGIE